MEKALIGFKFIVGCFLIVLFVVLPIATLNSCAKQAMETVEYEEQILSLNYGSELSGHFTLGCGAIGEKQYFVAYKVLEDGGKMVEKYPADVTVIYDNLEPGETTYAKVTKNGYGSFVSIHLYVPKGTIKQEYDLSLELE